jgi:hypothetical protein
MLPWKDRGIPGYLAVLFVRATVHDPAGCATASPVMAAATLLPSGSGKSLGTRDVYFAWLCNPRLGTLAYLRINGDVATTAARLATGLPGSALAGRGSHPQDDTRISRSHRILPSLRFRPCLVASPRNPQESQK